MPLEKQNNSQSRPLMPTLSTGNKAQRAPITPRIAASGSPSLSPLIRRGTAPADPNVLSKASTKDEISTPVKTFLGSNVTPRSSSRKAKVDTNLTPTGTSHEILSSSRSTTENCGYSESYQDGSSFGMPMARETSPERPSSLISEGFSVYSSNQSPSHVNGLGQSDRFQQGQDSPRFFYASDAKSSQKSVPSRPPLPTKHSSFLYANGERDDAGSVNSMSSVDGRSQSRFVHANGLPDGQVTSPPAARPKSQSNASSVNSPRLAAFGQPTSNRPPSPAKQGSRWPQPGVKSPPLASPPVQRPISSPFANTNTPSTTIRSYQQASSTQHDASSQPLTARRESHGRSVSVGSLDTSPTTHSIKRPMRTESISTSISSAFISNPRSSINEDFEAVTDSDLVVDEVKTYPQSPPLIPSTPQSPTKSVSAGGSLAHLNELAEKARRERKVQDLEISNSSLLAINRALEREMRKQSTELRRFRRLSRSGRLSLTGSGMGSGKSKSKGMSSSGHLPSLQERDDDGADLDSDDDQSTSSSSTSYSISEDEEDDEDEARDGETQAASDLRHRAKDEMRLQLDLSKHRQLLVDSQKMNQSLKRCLGRTEILIEEGRKALDFQVRVSEVNIGGRVLVDDGDDDEEEGRSGDGEIGIEKKTTPLQDPDSPTIDAASSRYQRSHNPGSGVDDDNAAAAELGKDRDSGVDCDLSRPVTLENRELVLV